MSRILSTAAVVLIPLAAAAQTEPVQPTTGSINFGVRGTFVTGDPARYERYRNLNDGLFVQRLWANRQTNRWLFNLSGDDIGRSDQRFIGNAIRPGKFRAFGIWDQIPLTVSRSTQTLFVEDIHEEPPVLTISDAIQAQAQAVPASLEPIFNASAVTFDTRLRRSIGRGGFEYLATPALTIRSQVVYTNRDGNLPYGGSFGHSSFVEFPAPIEQHTTDFEASAEFARNRLLLRAGYAGSFFHNDNTTATFDNPFRAVDISATPSRGRVSLAPSNTFLTVNGLASVRLPARSRAYAYVSVGSLSDAGAPLMPQTINTANVTAPVERSEVDGKARTTAVNLGFVSRPTRHTDLTVLFRSYDYDNRTAVFNMTQRVSFDNTPANLTSPVPTEPFSVIRRTFDADFKVTAIPGGTAGVGFTRLQEKRSHRIFNSTTENVARITFDSVGRGPFSLRTKYEHAERRGVGIEEGELELAAIGEQPGMRHFDIAPRDRDRVTILGTMTPTGTLSLSASAGVGKDDYRLDLPRTATDLDSLFGLRDNTHRVYTAGVDASPIGSLTLGGSYSFEYYNALSRSRQANPGVEFTDPRRNWSAEGTDRVHSIIVTAGITEIREKIDLRFTYDYNRARALYEYIAGAVPDRTLPEETSVATTLPPPTALPLVRSELGTGIVDILYSLTPRLSAGLSYWYERYRVTDFTLDAEANPVLVRGQAVLLGYLYGPYTGTTIWTRLIYRW